uniref:Uncharacterized protein n=1 Tax=Palpitomonas bilix TaxID=652834 RepID=A0A7S3D3J7_9EUKA|mmetsp:Transcript_20619/g.53017  ORF Transcript_20619/g.53017 Transcript_20619/m.53017 type:complete len:125 (+) Transcript_20619:135-509(+)
MSHHMRSQQLTDKCIDCTKYCLRPSPHVDKQQQRRNVQWPTRKQVDKLQYFDGVPGPAVTHLREAGESSTSNERKEIGANRHLYGRVSKRGDKKGTIGDGTVTYYTARSSTKLGRRQATHQAHI